MNKHDRDNLEFLLYASPDVIADWMSKVDEDDIAYAHELLAMAAEELNEQARALVVEAKLAQMDRYALAEKVISLVK
jgi:hypothetical protein